ncbi:lantibiotic dehydratase [Spirosoma sp. RP8]|uniref:Lantibiotic dehydratase n=1 Tax=Spirosoma liriopis TaxID=2937440 RepID=A0ABT0HVD8_9BACT|nr:lantibiotic dehydratase [Spirosoma liriopis]MCK8496077.1 lantibiotic dehydratase [Spirosoma liriopis]
MKVSFFKNFVVRTPVKSLDFLQNLLFSEEDINKLIVEILQNREILNALYLASPSIYQEIKKLNTNSSVNTTFKEKTLHSLLKYLIRMSYRSTPFGLFASIGLGHVNNNVVDLKKDSFECVVILDYTIEHQLYHKLNEITSFKKNLLFYPNSSIYTLNNNVFYVNSEFDKEISYSLSSFEDDGFLLDLIKIIKHGSSYSNIVTIITDQGFDESEALSYVDDLIDNNILLSELTYKNRDSNFILQYLIDLINKNLPYYHIQDNDLFLLRNYQTVIKEILINLEIIKNNLDNKIEFDLQDYSYNIQKLLSSIDIHYDSNKILQIDAVENTSDKFISNELLNDVSESISILNKLSTPITNNSLDQFKKDFHIKFEDQFVPLIKVLDKNYGLDYSARNLTRPNTSTNFSKKDYFLHKLLLSSLNGNSIIDLSNFDLSDFEESWNNVSSSFSCLIQIYEMNNENQIVVKEVGGSSAVNIISRFGHVSSPISQYIDDILEYESTVSTGLIANVTHLPNVKSGNILRNSVSRRHEINVFSVHSNESLSIPLDDIYVTVKKDEIILFSKSLNVRIFPKIDSAYNVNFSNLTIFQFLNDIENAGKKISMTFDWGILKQFFSHFPRIKYKNCIVSLATWIIKKDDIPPLLFTDQENENSLFDHFINELKLPYTFNLSEGDQLLYIDIRNKVLFTIFKKHLINNKVSTLTEILPMNDFHSIVKDNRNNKYAHEIVLGVKNENTQTQSHFNNDFVFTSNSIKRSFNIGDDWLYFKVYCSPNVSNLLILSIYKVFKDQLFENFAEKFFFVRYRDSEPHIRIRFFKERIDINTIVRKINEHITLSHLNEYIKSSSIETYTRELERYGEKNIEHVEDIFFYDSIIVCDLLNKHKSDLNKVLFYLDYIDYILSKLDYSLTEKIHFVTINKDSYLNEFHNASNLKNELANFYRTNKSSISSSLNHDTNIESICDKNYFELMIEKFLFIKNNTDVRTFYKIITSCIHMSVNRAFIKEQRLSELYIYQMLFHRYRSLKRV